MDSLPLRLLPKTDVSAVGRLGRPVAVVDATTSCERVDAMLRGDECVQCLVVRDGDGRVGLVSRARFQQTMAGPLGYGRTLSTRKPVAEYTDWSPVVMSHDLEVAEAARQVLARGDPQQLSEILVVSADGALGYVKVTERFRSLSSQFATRALTDGLTGLANRELFLDQLDRSCERVNDGHGRVGVL